MDPLMALLCLLPLYPGRSKGGRMLGSSRRDRATRLSFHACNRESLLLPLSHLRLPSSFLCRVPMPTGLAEATPSCSRNVNIAGGNFTLSQGWAPGSVLIYSCPLGRYPSPATRLCLSNGQWQTLRSTRLTKAVCKREAFRGPCSGHPASGHP